MKKVKEKKIILPNGREVGIKKMTEIVDENGKSISGIMGVQVYKKSLIIFTKSAMYTDHPELFSHLKSSKI